MNSEVAYRLTWRRTWVQVTCRSGSPSHGRLVPIQMDSPFLRYSYASPPPYPEDWLATMLGISVSGDAASRPRLCRDLVLRR